MKFNFDLFMAYTRKKSQQARLMFVLVHFLKIYASTEEAKNEDNWRDDFSRSEIQRLMMSSEGICGNTNKKGHLQEHWLGANTDYYPTRTPTAIGEKIDKKGLHTVFHGSNPVDIFHFGINNDPSISHQLNNIRPWQRDTISVNLKGYKGDKGFVEIHSSLQGALPYPVIQKAQEVRCVVDRKENGKLHFQTVFPRRYDSLENAERIRDLFSSK